MRFSATGSSRGYRNSSAACLFSWSVAMATSASAARTRKASTSVSRNIVGSTDIQTMPVLTCDPRGSGDVLAKPECFAAPAVGEAGHLRLAQHRRAVLRQPRPLGVQERPVRRQQEVPVPPVGVQRVQPSTASAGRRHEPGLGLHQRHADQPNFGLLPEDNKYGHRILQMAFKFYF